MGLEEMLSRIKSDTEEQYSKIISDAQKESEKILSEANQKASNITIQSKAQAERQVQEEKQRSFASARLESKRKLLEAKDALLKNFEDQAQNYLDEFVKSPSYKDFLNSAVNDGVSLIGSDAVISVNSRDKGMLGNKDSSYTISSKPLNSKGGALITSNDGKRKVDNTIESIFNDRKEELRLKLSEQIFGK